jgi:recombination protein RecA
MAKKKAEEKGGIQEALDKLNKQYGVGTILALDSKSGGNYDVISTGSIGFDHITLGVGGFVKGKMYELMGWEGTGKSTICGHVTAECQKKGGTVLYIDGEHAVDKKYFQALGVDTTKMLIAQPSCGEEGFNIAMEMIKTGDIDLVIIDSDSSLIPKKVLDGEVGDSSIGKKALLNSNAYPKLKSALSEHNVCVIVMSLR